MNTNISALVYFLLSIIFFVALLFFISSVTPNVVVFKEYVLLEANEDEVQDVLIKHGGSLFNLEFQLSGINKIEVQRNNIVSSATYSSNFNAQIDTNYYTFQINANSAKSTRLSIVYSKLINDGNLIDFFIKPIVFLKLYKYKKHLLEKLNYIHFLISKFRGSNEIKIHKQGFYNIDYLSVKEMFNANSKLEINRKLLAISNRTNEILFTKGIDSIAAEKFFYRIYWNKIDHYQAIEVIGILEKKEQNDVLSRAYKIVHYDNAFIAEGSLKTLIKDETHIIDSLGQAIQKESKQKTFLVYSTIQNPMTLNQFSQINILGIGYTIKYKAKIDSVEIPKISDTLKYN